MILPAALANLAARGRATIALIPIRAARTVRRKNGTSYTSQPWAPRRRRHEALLSRTARKTTKVADIIIGDHRQALLIDLLSDPQAALPFVKKLGYKTRAQFADIWMRHYDPRWPILVEELCPACDGHNLGPDGFDCPDCDPVGTILVATTPSDEEILDAFFSRHGRTLVYVVSVELDHDDHTRFLSRASRPRGDELGYTSTDVIDAGAAVPASFQHIISKKASERDDLMRSRKIEEGDLDDLDSGKLARSAKRARGRAA